MSAEAQYQRIYERERKARILAEKLLEEKSRALYDKVLELQSTLEQLNGAQAQLLQSEKWRQSVSWPLGSPMKSIIRLDFV